MTPSTSHSTDHSDLRLTGIERARRSALQDRNSLPAGWIAPWVEQSWQRCLDIGLQPDKHPVFNVLSPQHVHRTLEANQRLVQTAKPILEVLGRAIVNTRYFAILTNAQGVVVDVSGQIDRSDPRAHLITRIGTDLSEQSVGTTAIGTALAEKQAVWLHRGEHFFAGTAHYSCAGAPLFGPDGACIGMLDLTGIDAVERPELKHLVTQSASKIENAMVLAQAHTLMVRLNWPGNTMGGEADGMLCLDADGWVTGANPSARQMAPLLGNKGDAPVHLSEVFGMPYEMLFDAARLASGAIEVPLWSGLRLQALAFAPSSESLSVATPTRPQATQSLQLKDIEDHLIRQAVEHARGNVAEAARALGISRATVYRKLGKH
jgi:transcriptional regulator of acetoin/glycerol metabolism